MLNPIPEGYRTVTPSFTFKDSKKAIEFYARAFEAKVMDIFPSPDGKGIMHATIKFGGGNYQGFADQFLSLCAQC